MLTVKVKRSFHSVTRTQYRHSIFANTHDESFSENLLSLKPENETCLKIANMKTQNHITNKQNKRNRRINV
jgi:hypothetical protein